MSLAWCPNCEFLTNDVSMPCFECGGVLEYATLVLPTQEPEEEKRTTCPACDGGRIHGQYGVDNVHSCHVCKGLGILSEQEENDEPEHRKVKGR